MELSPFKKFVAGAMALLFLGYILNFSFPPIFLVFPILALAAAFILGAEFFRKKSEGITSPFRVLTGSTEFLCDDCKWNYGSVCTRPERPNATRCPDFKRK
ncbi:MAG: hypothetical protein O3B01_25250 [Planctomycetota bacterium]|nr:hypothetical protein [Planctomycetota bacterium]MDA1141884.1 hypothetical protein [Planctomycetota bacterium]